MITIKQYAKKHKLSERTAHKHLDEKVDRGFMERRRGPNNVYLYYEKTYSPVRWHDPFNRTVKYELARSLQAMPEAETKAEAVAKPTSVPKQKPMAPHATTSHDPASV